MGSDGGSHIPVLTRIWRGGPRDEYRGYKHTAQYSQVDEHRRLEVWHGPHARIYEWRDEKSCRGGDESDDLSILLDASSDRAWLTFPRRLRTASVESAGILFEPMGGAEELWPGGGYMPDVDEWAKKGGAKDRTGDRLAWLQQMSFKYGVPPQNG